MAGGAQHRSPPWGEFGRGSPFPAVGVQECHPKKILKFCMQFSEFWVN